MTKGRMLLLAALALLAGAVVLLVKLSAGADAVEVAPAPAGAAAGTAPAPATPASRTPREGAAPALAAAGRAAAVRDPDDPPELAIQPIRRAYVQREHDDTPRAKDAPPPLFTRETMQALRAAAAPAVGQCIAAAVARFPEMKELEAQLSVSTIVTARAADGTVQVVEARSTINNLSDDELVRCLEEEAYARVAIRSPSGQREGEGAVLQIFDVPK